MCSAPAALAACIQRSARSTGRDMHPAPSCATKPSRSGWEANAGMEDDHLLRREPGVIEHILQQDATPLGVGDGTKSPRIARRLALRVEFTASIATALDGRSYLLSRGWRSG
eukprot:scaffold18898_cov29-Tisochrysis_lutea.AAC.3